MERKQRAHLAAVLAVLFIALAALTATLASRIVLNLVSRSGSDAYATLSIPERNQAIVLFNDGAGGTFALYDDGGHCVRKGERLDAIARGDQRLYAQFIDVVDNEAIMVGLYQSQDGAYTDAVYYGIDLDTLEIRQIVALSDFIDLSKEGFFQSQPAATGDQGDFCIVALVDRATTEQGSMVSTYRYYRLSKGENGYSCSQTDLTRQTSFYAGFTKASGAVLIDFDGNIVAPDMSDDPIFVDDGTRIGTANSNYTVYPDGVEFYNVDSDMWVYLPFEDAQTLRLSSERQGAYARLADAGFDPESITAGTLDNSGFFTTSYVDGDGETVNVYERYDGSFFELSRYLPDHITLLLMQAAAIAIPLIIEAIALILVYRFAVTYGLRITVFGKIFVALAAIFAIIAFASTTLVDSIMSQQAERSARSEAYAYGQAATMLPDLERLDALAQGAVELKARSISEGLIDYGSDSATPSVEGEDLSEAQREVSTLFMTDLLYLYRDGKLYQMNGANPVDAPIDRAISPHVGDLLRACETDTVVEAQDIQASNSIIFPIHSPSNGSVIGAIEIRYSTSYAGYANASAMRSMLMGVLGLIAALFIAMLIWLKLSLQSIGRLGHAVHELMEGNMTARVPERGIDEVAIIGRTFNRMAENLSNRAREQHDSTEQYARFIPADTIRQLGHDRIADMKLGDYSVFATASLSSACLNYSTAAGSSVRDRYAFINTHLPVQIDIVNELGGVVNQMSEGGLEAYFRDRSGAALKAAIRIASFLNHDSARSVPNAAYACVLSYGDTALGVVGNDERVSLEHISQQANITRRLLRVAADFGIEVLMTQAFVDRLGTADGDSASSRRIGRVRTDEGTENVYEVLDGIDPEQRRRRQESMPIFNEGVTAFEDGDYLEAHRHFADVLRINGTDTVALRYFYLCDRGLERKLPLAGVIDDIRPQA